MSALTQLTIAEARDRLRRRQIGAVELTEAHLRAMESARALNAFVTETPELALTRARAADHLLGRGEGGPLAGIPLGIKDLFCTEGVRTTPARKFSAISCRLTNRRFRPNCARPAR